MRTLEVSGKTVLIDDDWHEPISRLKWGINHYGYAVTSSGVWMHRLVIDAPRMLNGERAFVDHIDRNTLNNQTSNLRLCTHSQNLANRPKPRNAAAGYKGVYLHSKYRPPKAPKWMARITVNYKGIYLGLFSDAIDAARAYDTAARKYFGEFAWTNNV